MRTLASWLLALTCFALLAAAINPANNAEIPACQSLAQSIGPQALPQCHIMLSPAYFGYPTQVDVHILVKTIYGLDEKELMDWSGWIRMTWTDPRLAWNSSLSNLSYLQVNRDSIWIPDIGFLNAKDNEMFDLRNSKFLDSVVYSSGDVAVYTYVEVPFACALDMKFFPFDNQTCSFQMSTVTSGIETMNFTVVAELFPGNNSGLEFYQVGEWILQNITYEMHVVGMGVEAFHWVGVRFSLRRKWTYYVVLLIVPFELLSLLAGIMFLAGEKSDPVNISIAIIMSMTLYVLIASQSAPTSMNSIPLVGLFLIVQMLILITFTFVAAVYPKELAQSDKDSKILSMIKGVLTRHRDIICFGSYVFISILNAFVFLYLWPLAQKD